MRPVHGRFYNFFFIMALMAIVAVFGAIGYVLVTMSDTPNLPSLNPLTVVELTGIGIGALAGLTGIFYLISQLDTRLNDRGYGYDYSDEEDDGPANYAAPQS